MRLFILIFILVPSISFCQKARNEDTEYNNIYAYCINAIIDSLSEEQKQEFTLILKGEPAEDIIDWSINMNNLNGEKNSISNSRGKLKRDYKYLINKRLINIYLRNLYLKDSRLLISIFMVEEKYHNRRKSDSDKFESGIWIFYLLYNEESDSFEIEKIQNEIYL